EREQGEGARGRSECREPAAGAGDRPGVAGHRADGEGHADDRRHGRRERRGRRRTLGAVRNVVGDRRPAERACGRSVHGYGASRFGSAFDRPRADRRPQGRIGGRVLRPGTQGFPSYADWAGSRRSPAPALMSNTLRSLALLARGIGIAAGAFAIAHIGNLSLGEHGLAVWWPLNGIIVATLMIAPRERTARILTAVTAGNLAAYIYSDFGILSGWYALGDAAEISIATWGLRRFVGDRVALSDTRHVLAIVVTAVFAAIPPGLVCAVLAARVGHHGFLSFFRTWWLADALGMILAAPAVVGLVDLFRRRRSFATRVWIESGLMTVLTFAAAAAAMSQSSIGTMDLAADARYLVFPFLIWSALRLSPQVTAVAVMTGALSAACIATPFVHPVMASAVAHMFAIQLFLGIV